MLANPGACVSFEEHARAPGQCCFPPGPTSPALREQLLCRLSEAIGNEMLASACLCPAAQTPGCAHRNPACLSQSCTHGRASTRCDGVLAHVPCRTWRRPCCARRRPTWSPPPPSACWPPAGQPPTHPPGLITEKTLGKAPAARARCGRTWRSCAGCRQRRRSRRVGGPPRWGSGGAPLGSPSRSRCAAQNIREGLRGRGEDTCVLLFGSSCCKGVPSAL